MNDNASAQIIIDALAALLRDRPLIRLEHRDEVWRFFYHYRIETGVVNKCLDAVIARAKEMRAEQSTPARSM